MGQSYHTNEAVDGKVPKALSHRLVGALTPHSQCGVYDAKVYLRPEGTLQNVADNIERPLGTRFSRHTYPTHRTFVLMCGVKAPVGEDVPWDMPHHYDVTPKITWDNLIVQMRQFYFHQKRQHRYDVFVKPRAEGKLAFTMPRRENDCCEETNLFFKHYLKIENEE